MASFSKIMIVLSLLITTQAYSTQKTTATEFEEWKTLFDNDITHFLNGLTEFKLHGQTFDSIKNMYRVSTKKDLTKTSQQKEFSNEAMVKIKQHVENTIKDVRETKLRQRMTRTPSPTQRTR